MSARDLSETTITEPVEKRLIEETDPPASAVNEPSELGRNRERRDQPTTSGAQRSIP